MSDAQRSLARNIRQSRDLAGLAIGLRSVTTPAIDLSDVLRSAVVSSVSSLDHYVHEIVRELLIAMGAGTLQRSRGFESFEVTVSSLASAIKGEPPAIWLAAEIRRQHGHLAFQMPDKIADAIRLVHDEPLWPAVATLLQTDSASVKRDLKLVVERVRGHVIVLVGGQEKSSR